MWTLYVGRTDVPISAILTYNYYGHYRGAGLGPLFVFTDGKPLTRTTFVARVKQALEEAGVDQT